MSDKVKIKLDKGKATMEEGADSALGKILAANKGNLTIKTPYGRRKVKVS